MSLDFPRCPNNPMMWLITKVSRNIIVVAFWSCLFVCAQPKEHTLAVTTTSRSSSYHWDKTKATTTSMWTYGVFDIVLHCHAILLYCMLFVLSWLWFFFICGLRVLSCLYAFAYLCGCAHIYVYAHTMPWLFFACLYFGACSFPFYFPAYLPLEDKGEHIWKS